MVLFTGLLGWRGLIKYEYREIVDMVQKCLDNVITCQIEMPFKGQFFTSAMKAESMSDIVAIST